jgi:hypothetical protein
VGGRTKTHPEFQRQRTSRERLGPSLRGGDVSGPREGWATSSQPHQSGTLERGPRPSSAPHRGLAPGRRLRMPQCRGAVGRSAKNKPDYPLQHTSSCRHRAQTRRGSADGPPALSPLEPPPNRLALKKAILTRRKPLANNIF